MVVVVVVVVVAVVVQELYSYKLLCVQEFSEQRFFAFISLCVD